MYNISTAPLFNVLQYMKERAFPKKDALFKNILKFFRPDLFLIGPKFLLKSAQSKRIGYVKQEVVR